MLNNMEFTTEKLNLITLYSFKLKFEILLFDEKQEKTTSDLIKDLEYPKYEFDYFKIKEDYLNRFINLYRLKDKDGKDLSWIYTGSDYRHIFDTIESEPNFRRVKSSLRNGKINFLINEQ